MCLLSLLTIFIDWNYTYADWYEPSQEAGSCQSACVSFYELIYGYTFAKLNAKDMRPNKKDSVATWSAVGMLAFGVGITTAGFIIPPSGEIHDSVLWVLGQALLYSGSIFGITLYTKRKLGEIEETIANRLPKDKNIKNEDYQEGLQG